MPGSHTNIVYKDNKENFYGKKYLNRLNKSFFINGETYFDQIGDFKNFIFKVVNKKKFN